MVKRPLLGGKSVNKSELETFDYRSHILIGYASTGNMTVIYHWPHLPRQTEVEQTISRQTGYVIFLLCTPTSILPVNTNEERELRSSST
jgi:hypothetical protein